MENRVNRRKILSGVVISDKMMKTRVVEVRSHGTHAKYGKLTPHYSRYKAHDEQNSTHTGDTVTMSLTRPLSKDKRWVITAITKKASLNDGVVAI